MNMSGENKKPKSKNFKRVEWISILLIFIIAVMTGYFFMTQRLEKADMKTLPDEPAAITPGDEKSENSE
jgi:preprotein translocase subunit YajC